MTRDTTTIQVPMTTKILHNLYFHNYWLPWCIYTNFHGFWRNISSYTQNSYTITCLHQLTTLYYKLNTHVLRHDGPWLCQQLNKLSQTHRRVPSGTVKRKLNTTQNSHAYMWHSTLGVRVNRLQNATCGVQKKRVVCNYITIYRTHILFIEHIHHNVTQTFIWRTITHNVHSDTYFVLPNTQAFTQDI